MNMGFRIFFLAGLVRRLVRAQFIFAHNNNKNNNKTHNNKTNEKFSLNVFVFLKY